MKHIVIYSSVCGASSRSLDKALNTRSNGECKARVINPYKDDVPLNPGDIVFAYGCSASNYSQHQHRRINSRYAVLNCVDKLVTFDLLRKNKIPTVESVSSYEDIPFHWKTIVYREKVDGKKAEGLEYLSQEEIPLFKNGELYTEYFEHRYEYRIVVFMGQVVGRYYKADKEGEWHFIKQRKDGFEEMDKACLKAAKVLGIDYVGFDVVSRNKKDFRILEANSGPVLTDEAEDAIVNYFINLKD